MPRRSSGGQTVARRDGRIANQPEKGALCELLKTNSLYDTETFCARVPMDLSRIKVFRGQTSPIAIESVIGPDAMPFVSEPRKFIPRSQSEINRHSQHHPPPIPYNDPALNNPRFKLKFIRHLFSVGLLTFRFKVLAYLGFFTVGKKDGSQRLIGDARSANWLHRRASYSPLAAAGPSRMHGFRNPTGPTRRVRESIFKMASTSLDLIAWPPTSASICGCERGTSV